MARQAAIPTIQNPPIRGASLLLADAFGKAMREGQYKPGDRLPTRREIVQHTGLGYGTVTRTMEILADRKLIEQRPGAGAFVSYLQHPSDQTATKRIGVILPFWATDPSQPILHSHLEGINEQASLDGHRVELIPNRGDDAAQHKFIDRVLALRLDGLVWFVPSLDHEINIARLLDRPPLQVITTVRRFHRTPVEVVREDVNRVGELIVEAMIRRKRKRLMMICREGRSDAHSSDFIEAIRIACAKYGLPFIDDQIFPVMGQLNAGQMIRDGMNTSDFDAVFSLNSAMLEPLAALHAAGRDMDIFQLWGNAQLIRMRWPALPIGVIETPVAAMGRQAIKQLNKRWKIETDEDENLSPRLDEPLEWK